MPLSRADLQALRAFLTPPLDLLDPGLGAAACAYVLHGGAAPKITGQASPASRRALSTLLGYHPDPSAHRVFLAPGSWDPAAALRLGGVLFAVARCRGRAGHLPGSPSSPDSFRALAHVTAALATRATDPSTAWLLTGPRCLDLLALAGADAAALVDVLFADLDLRDRRRRSLLSLHGLAAALAVAPGHTCAAARALDRQGRCSFLAWLGASGPASVPVFFEELLAALAHQDSEAEVAMSALTACPIGQRLAGATRLLARPQPACHNAAARLLLQIGTPAARDLLAQAVTGEASRARPRTRQALLLLDALLDLGTAEDRMGEGYRAISGEWIALPPAAVPADTPLPEGFGEGLRAAVAAFQCAVHRGQRGTDPDLLSASAIEELQAVLSGRQAPGEASEAARALVDPRRVPGDTRPIEEYGQALEGLLSLPGITVHHLVRAAALLRGRHTWAEALLGRGSTAVQRRLRDVTLSLGDLRPVLAIGAPLGCGAGDLITHLLHGGLEPLDAASRTLLWPVIASHLDLIDQAVGLAPSVHRGRRAVPAALALLSVLPAPPRHTLPVLLDRGLRGGRQERALARALLPDTADLTALIAAHLTGGTAIAAAQWLGGRRDTAAIPALRSALANDTRDSTKAALLAALKSLGAALPLEMDEGQLLEEARAGLARTRTRVGECVPLDHLPPLIWADGRHVPAELVCWWIVLADKLRQPRADVQLARLLEPLDPASARQLGQLVLSAFIAFDSRRPTEEEANAFAEAHADQAVQRYQDFGVSMTREAAFARLKEQKLREHLHSAHRHRGILALSAHAPAREAVSQVNAHLRDHHRRTAACRDLLEALAGHDSPTALQLLQGIARRHRSAALRAHAGGLLKALAQARGWTLEELADRTLSDGGLDARGVLPLETDSGCYVARVDAQLHIGISNPHGRPVKSLPAGGGPVSAAARARLSELRREIKETVPLATARLHEAMCAGRIWRREDLLVLLQHPIAGRLCRRVIFACLDESGAMVGSFRPLGDGTLSNAADEPMDLAACAGMRIAHRLLLDEPQCAAWQQHLTDYDVTPLFPQLTRAALCAADAGPDPVALREREGHIVDAATLRALAARLGYQGTRQEPSGRFRLEKVFALSGITATLELAGGPLESGSAPCALLALRFVAPDNRHGMRLSGLPPVMLSEAWNDLREIADAGSGLDPQWRARIGW